MAKRAGSSEERLDDTSIERCIKYLEEPKATKKNACQILNISYNTARLDKLIEQYKTRKENDAKRRAENRGKPATKEEIAFIISEYLENGTITSISKSLFRGPVFIKSILDTYGAPTRNASSDYFHPQLIPEESTRERFAVGEEVWSARYDVLAKIDKELFQKGIYVYRVYLKGEQNMWAYQPACELASLEKLRNEGFIK